MRFDLLHPADQLVMIMQRIYEYGMTTTSGGNLSIRDENGDVWITPSGIDRGSLIRQDVCCVRPDGMVIGPHKPSVELPFHLDILKSAPTSGPSCTPVRRRWSPSAWRALPAENLATGLRQVCGEIVMAD